MLFLGFIICSCELQPLCAAGTALQAGLLGPVGGGQAQPQQLAGGQISAPACMCRCKHRTRRMPPSPDSLHLRFCCTPHLLILIACCHPLKLWQQGGVSCSAPANRARCLAGSDISNLTGLSRRCGPTMRLQPCAAATSCKLRAPSCRCVTIIFRPVAGG